MIACARLRLVLFTAATLFSAVAARGQNPADLYALSNAGFIITSTDTNYPTNKVWESYVNLMRQVPSFDRVASRIEDIVCGQNHNRSVLLVGEPSQTYAYVFARFAASKRESCQKLSHVEINVNKIEAGHHFVGDVEQYWNDNVLEPSDKKDVVLYFSNLNALIGIGSHSHDDNGIETEYSANIREGRIRTVAFMNKYEYDFYLRSPHGYVLNTFAETIKLEPLTEQEVDAFVKSYLSVFSPHKYLRNEDALYLKRMISYYLPNMLEPERSVAILQYLVRNYGAIEHEAFSEGLDDTYQTPHPYENNFKWTKEVTIPNSFEINLTFKDFDTESNLDVLTVFDAHTNQELAKFSGKLGNFTTKGFTTNSVRLEFSTDSTTTQNGFQIVSVGYKRQKPGSNLFLREHVRQSVMEISQLPRWMIDRNFSILRDLQANLDGDVVGCEEAKLDTVRLAKVGYVSGRTDEKPVGTIMYVGPTGTGKSYMAKKLADFTGIKMITIDMTSYRTPESFDRFLEVMATNLQLYPYSIFLFEEIDKADSKVLDRLYFMLDEGIFYDRYQRPLSARGSFIIMTSNAAEEAILQNPNDPNLRDKVNDELRKLFRASFLNRFDAISIFKPFTQAQYRQLANTLISKKLKKFKEMYDWTVNVDQGTTEYVAVHGQSARYGARPMERLIDNVLAYGIAEYQLNIAGIEFGADIGFTKLAAVDQFAITVDGGQHEFTVNRSINGGEKRSMMSVQLRELYEHYLQVLAD